jgi:GAF domain-containing protein
MADDHGADQNYVARALVGFAEGPADNRTVESVLQALGDYCTELLPVDSVGVLLLEDGDVSVATTNSPEGDAVEGLEVELGQGPCIDSIRTGYPVVVPDLAEAHDRYPAFAPRALDAGIRSIHALPMVGRGEVVGSLDVLCRTVTELSETELATAQMLADAAVSYIFTVRLHEESTKLAAQLQDALDNRVVIEQAKGILFERHGGSMGDAFDRLRAHARSHNETVRRVAEQVVERRLRP